MTFEVLPALSYRLPQIPGRARREAMEAVATQIRDLAGTHGGVYVVDERGLDRNKPDVAFLQELAPLEGLWVDAGPRTVMDVMDVLVAGAGSTVVRWPNVESAGEVRAAAELSPNLHLGLVFEGDALVPNPREPGADVEALVAVARELSLGLVLVGLPDARGQRAAPRTLAAAVRHHAGSKRFLGWTATPGSRAELAELGFDGVFVEASSLEAGSGV